ncbi:MAG: hypothetical protein ACR2M4_12405 [Actinomycetota bacterium]
MRLIDPLSDGSSPPRVKDKIITQVPAVFAKRISVGTLESGWIQFKAWLIKRDARIPHQLTLAADNVRIWLWVSPTDSALPPLDTDDAYTILLHTRDRVVLPAYDALRVAGFSEGVYLSTSDFEVICEQAARVHLVPRHTDLHCGNVLYGNGRTKIIDLGSI